MIKSRNFGIMRTIFPKCFGSHYILRRHYFVYAIFGFAAMAAINYLISGRKKAVDVFVVEEHHEALRYWHHLTVTGAMNRTGNTLIHIDGHSDMAPPDYVKGFPFFKWPLNEAELYVMMQKNDVFIQDAIIIGMLDHMIWIYPSWDKSEEFGDYAAFIYEIGHMKRTIEGKNQTIFCECHTPLNKYTHQVVEDGVSECSYLDESQAKIEDAEVSIEKSRCNVKREMLFEVVIDEVALEMFEKSAWVTKPKNVILDIDEDFFGCERGGKVLEKTHINWNLVEQFNDLTTAMICPKNVMYEEEGDVLMKDLIVRYIQICELKKSQSCSIKPEAVLDDIKRPVLETLHKRPRLFCQNVVTTMAILQEMINLLKLFTLEQIEAVVRLGFCLNTTPVTLGFDQGRAEFTICHGANTVNETLVVLYTPDSVEEVTTRLSMLESTLEHLSDLSPNVVTLCRSIRDGYTPRHLTTQIETGILNFFRKRHRDIRYNVWYDSNLLGGDNGWDSRYKPYI